MTIPGGGNEAAAAANAASIVDIWPPFLKTATNWLKGGRRIALVTVDRDTGQIAIERYLAAYDVGVAINPMLVGGQIAGSMAQGLGGALLEEFSYDESGTPLAVTFADYLMPTCHEVPRLDVLLTEDAPSPINPLGVKGAGESGITGVGAALVSAINDALGVPSAVTQLPITPARLKRIMDRLSRFPPIAPAQRRGAQSTLPRPVVTQRQTPPLIS